MIPRLTLGEDTVPPGVLSGRVSCIKKICQIKPVELCAARTLVNNSTAEVALNAKYFHTQLLLPFLSVSQAGAIAETAPRIVFPMLVESLLRYTGYVPVGICCPSQRQKNSSLCTYAAYDT